MSEQHTPSKLQQTVAAGTDFWNDSCAISELRYALEHGAVGATSNPTIVLQVLRAEMGTWREPIARLIATHPTASEREITWRLVEQMAVGGAELLRPIFERSAGRTGRLSIQTDPTLYRDAAAITEQAAHFAGLAPNMQVKIPATEAGIAAIEQATLDGVSVNATVCFTVPQALAVAAAIERGLGQREQRGLDVARMAPVCTIMVGRLDDWLKVVAARDRIAVTPGDCDWAGIACIKRAHQIYRERGYRTRLLAAAYRSHLHWSELVGGDVVLTIPHGWQRLFNASAIDVLPRFDRVVEPQIVGRLLAGLPDFRRAYEVDGLSPAEFDGYGATRRTLRTFIASYHELLALVRDEMLPDPDQEGAR